MVQVHSESRCKPFCTSFTRQQQGTAEQKDGVDRESVKKQNDKREEFYIRKQFSFCLACSVVLGYHLRIDGSYSADADIPAE